MVSGFVFLLTSKFFEPYYGDSPVGYSSEEAKCFEPVQTFGLKKVLDGHANLFTEARSLFFVGSRSRVAKVIDPVDT